MNQLPQLILFDFYQAKKEFLENIFMRPNQLILETLIKTEFYLSIVIKCIF